MHPTCISARHKPDLAWGTPGLPWHRGCFCSHVALLVLPRLCEASWVGVTGPLMMRRLKSDAVKQQGWKSWKKSLKNSKRGRLGLKQQQENKMPSQCTSLNSAASAVIAASQATIPTAVGQAEELCPPPAVAVLAQQRLADTDAHQSGCSSVSSTTGCDSECLRGVNQMGKMLPFCCLEMEPLFNMEACFNSRRCFADTTGQ